MTATSKWDISNETKLKESHCKGGTLPATLTFGIENILQGKKSDGDGETEERITASRSFPVALTCIPDFYGQFVTVPRTKAGTWITPGRDVFFPWREITKDKTSFSHTRRIGHPYQNRTPPKRKKPRTSFSRLTIMELEKRFDRQKYLASSERSTLAKSLKISDSQVKTWFQNRRTKWRRQAAEEKEIERQTASRLLVTMGNYSSSKKFLRPSSY